MFRMGARSMLSAQSPRAAFHASSALPLEVTSRPHWKEALEVLTLPQLAPTCETYTIATGYGSVVMVPPGSEVTAGSALFEVETDKTVMPFEIEEDVVIAKFLVEDGQEIEAGAPVAITISGFPGRRCRGAHRHRRRGARLDSAIRK